MFSQIHKILGIKNYANFKLMKQLRPDYSYATISDVYDLLKWDYSSKLMNVIGLTWEFFSEIVPSKYILSTINKEASDENGLPQKMNVVCGGNDNSCLALDARNIDDGRCYISLGSSAWIAISLMKPIIDLKNKVF